MRRRRPADEPPPVIPTEPWQTFKARFYGEWKQGEHVSLIGPTGLGKTTLLLELLPRRDYTTIFGTKPKDATLAGLKKSGWTVTKRWPPPANRNRVILWPAISSVSMQLGQQLVFRHAMHKIYEAGSWCVAADDTNYLSQQLKLDDELRMLWMNGRSIGISLCVCIQRPAFVPTMAYDQATHLFFFREGDELALKRIGGIGWTDSRLIRETVATLPKHDLLYINSRTAEMVITRVERP